MFEFIYITVSVIIFVGTAVVTAWETPDDPGDVFINGVLPGMFLGLIWPVLLIWLAFWVPMWSFGKSVGLLKELLIRSGLITRREVCFVIDDIGDDGGLW